MILRAVFAVSLGTVYLHRMEAQELLLLMSFAVTPDPAHLSRSQALDTVYLLRNGSPGISAHYILCGTSRTGPLVEIPS